VDHAGADLFEACVEAVAAGATLGEVARAARIRDNACAPVTPVCITRAVTAFERLRAAMDRRAAKAEPRPQVFLLNLGKLRDYKARADFSRGFFAVGGYDVISPAGFATTEEAVAAFLKSTAQVAVICSTDEQYPALVPPLAAAIRASRSDAVLVLAGFPRDQVEAHKQAGVDEFIHLRADAVEVLSKIHARLGIEL
jgi:methylmalonyl-CoA mutase